MISWTNRINVSLAELSLSVTDGDHQAPPRAASGVPFITISALRSGRIDLRRATRFVPDSYLNVLHDSRTAKADDILFSVTGSIGLRGLVHDEYPFVFQRHIAIIRPNQAFCYPRWLWYMLATPQVQEAAQLKSSGTAQPTLPLHELRAIELPLKSGVGQRRIVAKLDSLTARLYRARAELGRVKALTSVVRRTALHRCFHLDVTPTTALGDLLEGVESGKNLRCDERPPRARELGVIKVSAVTWGRFDPSRAKTLPTGYVPPHKARINRGDFLISRANTLELVGAPVIVDDQPSNLFLSDKVLRLVMPDAEKKWVMWFLRSSDGRAQIERLATGNQLSMRNISQQALSKIVLPFPENRHARLTELEATFARADRLEAEAAHACALLDRLEAAILARAFRGELVPQDPDDEPASVLLDRIRARRAAAPKPLRRRRADATSA